MTYLGLVIALTGSIVFGLSAKDLQSQSDALCPEAACGNQTAISLNDDAQSAALKSNIFLGVGLASVAGAVVLWFLGAPAETDGPARAVSFVPVFDSQQAGISFVRGF